MQRSFAVVAVLAVLVLAACGTSDSVVAPGAGRAGFKPLASVGCTATNWDALKAEADSVMTAGSPSAQSVLGKLDNLIHQCTQENDATAKARAWDIVQFVLNKYQQGALNPLVPPGSTAEKEVRDFVNHVLASAGIDIQYVNLDNAWIVNPGDGMQTFVTKDSAAALVVSGADVDATTLITAEPLPPDPGYLVTDLDQYPRYYRFQKQAIDGLSGPDHSDFNNPVTVAICVRMPNSVGDEVYQRLRIAAQHSPGVTGFEVTAPATLPPELDCGTATSSARLKSAATGLRLGTGSGSAAIIGDDGSGLVERGGVGGQADNFSDFGVVDPQLSARGGVGGQADNFRPIGGVSLVLHNPSNCSTVDVPRGTEVSLDCRPMMTFRTEIGNTPLDGIPVTFSVLAGGGQVAIEDPADHSCGTFGSSVTAYSAMGTGEARVCWRLGTNAGLNQVGAKAGEGGDASAGTYFAYTGVEGTTADPNGVVFSANGLKTEPLASATGGAFVFNNAAHAGGGTCSDGLTPALSYTPGGTTAPVNAGSYTLTVTCGDGGINYNDVTATAGITITPGPVTVTVSCPASVPYNGAVQAPCTASVSGDGLSQSLPVTYTPSSPQNAGTYGAAATYSGGGNYQGNSGAGTFDITRLVATATAGSATINFGQAVPAISCTVTGLLAADAGTVTCSATATYSASGTYPTIPVISPTNPTNYTVTSVNGALTVRAYVQVGCFSSPVYNVMPVSKSAQRKGSNVPVKCTLNLPLGTPVKTATGKLEIFEYGSSLINLPPSNDPPAGAALVATIPGAFGPTSSGNYSYGLNTSPAYFRIGYYYFVRATWNDGSKTGGWFLLK